MVKKVIVEEDGKRKLENLLKKIFAEVGISLQDIDNRRDEEIEEELGIKRFVWSGSSGERSGHIPLESPPYEKVKKNLQIALNE